MNLICGINPVLEALGAGTRHFDRLIVVKGLRNQRISDAIARASRLGVPIRFESRETLDRMAAGVPHQGVIAVVSAKPTVDLESVLAQAHDPALLVALDGVEDPRNLGAILRTCEAAGADGVLLPDRHSVGLTETVGRASAGALEHVKVARVGNLAQTLEALKARGLWVIGFDAGGVQRWDAVDCKRPLALVLGGEGKGMRRLVRERCDQVVSIPLFGHVASLNVSVAAGVALYEVVRQRGVTPSHVRPIPPRAAPPARQVVGPPAHDDEHDPGATPVAAPVAEDDEAEPEHPIRVVGLLDDDVAWGHGLEAQRPVERGERDERRDAHRRGRDGRGGGREGRHQPPPDAAAGHRRDPASASAPAADQRGGGRRRHRRRGQGPRADDQRRPERGPDEPQPPRSDTGGEAGPAAEAGPPAPGAAGGGDARRDGPPGSRRRRRWRRRRGGPRRGQ